mgnify:FL=1
MLKFYKEVGTVPTGELNNYMFRGFNIFPAFWITITTPLPILFLTFIGIVHSLRKISSNKFSPHLLILLWFFIPIFRVTIPGSAIHSGVRHIMEFLPALAILAGIGAKVLYQISNFKTHKAVISLVLISSFGFVFWEVSQLHPNENIYFNQIIGGLSGAKEKDIPFWGYNYGNVYLQGVNWLNKNAEPNAKLALAVGNMVNIPRIKLRPDIDFSNAHMSGPHQNGEYVMEMSNNGGIKKMYGYAFYDTFLEPVHEVKVDGVALLTIWKNDSKYLKHNLIKESELKIRELSTKGSTLNIDLGEEILLTSLRIAHKSENCEAQRGGYVKLSTDNVTWTQEPETIDNIQIPFQWLKRDPNNFVFLFLYKPTRYIFIDTELTNPCLLKEPSVKVFGQSSLSINER